MYNGVLKILINNGCTKTNILYTRDMYEIDEHEQQTLKMTVTATSATGRNAEAYSTEHTHIEQY